MNEFDDIRSYDAQDMPRVFDELLADPQFLSILPQVVGDVPTEELRAQLYACKDPLDFQRKFIYPLVRKVMSAASTGLDTDVDALPDRTSPHTYISNHRDIVLDSALLSEQLIDLGFPTTPEIAIGDNLLIYPWIRHAVRLNKAFVVQRSLGLRETLVASQHMSRYMHRVIRDKRNPIWIAQREGRAKDSDDRTQESVLKMLAMGGDGTVLENIREMDIVPLTISYEFDPCDFLKAKEFQLKRDNPDYRKTREDDLQNMKTGIFGFKGRVHYQMGTPVNQWLDELAGLPKGEFFAALARRIDGEIFAGYRLFPSNLLALEALSGGSFRAATCSEAERAQFDAYLEGQLAKVDLPEPDYAFLRERILRMYANPAINHGALQPA
ncbi:MAG: acyltransferase [Alloprevotella sp.]|nr:acyltransferase [Alloprevotella sp.]MBR1653170.1 acyltransferase [Alloprevotella sp.]